MVSIAGVYDLLLSLLKEISYVSTRSEQMANANLSMSHGPKGPARDKYSEYFTKTTQPGAKIAWHKDNALPPKGKLSFNVNL